MPSAQMYCLGNTGKIRAYCDVNLQQMSWVPSTFAKNIDSSMEGCCDCIICNVAERGIAGVFSTRGTHGEYAAVHYPMKPC